jgi:two-component system, OmpR family, phosphate regulon sensor histidine kinase PhoR
LDSNKSWIYSRVSLRLLVGGIAGGIGWWIGYSMGYPVMTGLLMGSIAVMAVSVLDTLKGYEFLDWLRTPDLEPPQLPGLWGEAAHRIQRVLRIRDEKFKLEQDRMGHFLLGIEASPNGVMLLDPNDQITWISRSAAKHFGLDPVRDIAQRVTNLIRSPDFVHHLSEGLFAGPVILPMPQGGQGTLSVTVHPYGEGLKIVLSQDITERELTESMRRDFVANVSHEIRTPLTVLHGFIETMTNLRLTEVERERVLVLMMQQAERMQSLVADLLVLAQLEGSPRPTTDAWCNVADLVQRVCSDAKGLSKGQHDLRMEVLPAGEAFELAGVENEWFSAMGNLVTNAIRYTPAGGQVIIRWTCCEDGHGEFSVIDSGMGIDAAHIPRLTERFYRVDGSRSRDTGGTGLGLSIVKHVVQRHGGDLRVTSELGKGSTFTLHVPAKRVRRIAETQLKVVPHAA